MGDQRLRGPIDGQQRQSAEGRINEKVSAEVNNNPEQNRIIEKMRSGNQAGLKGFPSATDLLDLGSENGRHFKSNSQSESVSGRSTSKPESHLNTAPANQSHQETRIGDSHSREIPKEEPLKGIPEKAPASDVPAKALATKEAPVGGSEIKHKEGYSPMADTGDNTEKSLPRTADLPSTTTSPAGQSR